MRGPTLGPEQAIELERDPFSAITFERKEIGADQKSASYQNCKIKI